VGKGARTPPLVAALDPQGCHEVGNRLTFALGRHSARSVRLTKRYERAAAALEVEGLHEGQSG